MCTLGGWGARWDTSLGGLPTLACVQLAVSRWGVGCTLGYVPRRPSRPCLCPARSARWGWCARWDTSLGGLPVLACVLLALHAVGASPAGIRSSEASRPCLRLASSIPLGVLGTLCTSLGGLPALACVKLAVSLWGVLHPLGYIPRRPSRPCLRPVICIPLGGTSPAGIRLSG